MILQLCGMSGAGKSTLTRIVSEKLFNNGFEVEVIDGDDYRQYLCRDLGFSPTDRMENLRRLAFVASKLSAHGIVVIISAINPYQEMREEIADNYPGVKTVFIDCPVDVLKARDTKGLYARAMLPDNHPDKLANLTGINDRFDIPTRPDLHLNTSLQSISECTNKLYNFVIENVNSAQHYLHRYAG